MTSWPNMAARLRSRARGIEAVMKAIGVISFCTGTFGALMLYYAASSPWGAMMSFALFICVAVAHNWVATCRL